MRTRTLLLLAVTCGLLILVAGGIFMLRLSMQDPATPPLAVGESGSAGDVTVTVDAVDETDGRMTVTVLIGGISDDDALGGFTLSGVPNPVAPLADASTCTVITVAPASCTLVFPTAGFTTKDRQLLFIRAEERVRWRLV